MIDVSRISRSMVRMADRLVVNRQMAVLLSDKKIWRSRYFILFVITLFSSSSIAVIYNFQKLLKALRNRNNAVIKRSKSSLKMDNGARKIYVPYKENKTVQITIPRLNNDKYQSDYLQFKGLIRSLNSDSKRLFDSSFLKKIFLIWKLILIPKVVDPNTWLLLLQIFFLISRTYLSLLVTKLDGTIVKDLIGLNGKKFLRDLIYWFLLLFPASFTNASIKFLTKKLALNFRNNLIRYVHDMYLNKMMVYYKIQFKDIKNLDQYITEDIKKFTFSLTSLFSSIGKPFMDIIFFSVYLRDNLGTFGIIGIFINYFITGYFLKAKSPNFSKLMKHKTHLEGIFYNYNLNLINNCEEISFYKGIHLEKYKIATIFQQLIDQLTTEYNVKFVYQFYEDYVLKYTWSCFGYLFAAIPIFFSNGVKNENRNMKQFIINKRLMLSLLDAGSRLMFSIKDLSRLSGYTDRVFSLLACLHEVHSKEFAYGCESIEDLKGVIQKPYSGLRFEDVPIVVPPNNTLISQLNFTIGEGSNLLILGKNGVGKTSIMRLVSSIWPIYKGLLSRPADEDIMFVSQKSYFLNVGNLRDQIIYPLDYSQMLKKGYQDSDLIEILEEVGLAYLLKRFNDDLNYSPSEENQGNNPWFNLLSGGERQKMIIARILFHNKRFIVLDESTNAISFDLEDYLYEMLIRKKFTIITLSHRPLLIKYHDYVLELKGDDQYEFNYVKNSYNRSNNNSTLYLNSISREIESLESKLLEKTYLMKRQNELALLLDDFTIIKSSNTVTPIGRSTISYGSSDDDEDNELQIEINTRNFRDKTDNAEIDISIND